MKPAFIWGFFLVPGRFRRLVTIANEPIDKRMKKSPNYQSPRVLQSVSIRTENAFLKASLVDTATVTAVGQEVEEHDFSSDEFIHQWED